MDRRIKTTIEIINNEFASKVSAEDICKHVNLSPARLRQLFRKETGLSPFQYLKRLRMQKAANLLLRSFLSIKEVAFQSGARDLSHFVRDFKQYYGVTPSQFRARTYRDRRLIPKNYDRICQ